MDFFWMFGKVNISWLVWEEHFNTLLNLTNVLCAQAGKCLNVHKDGCDSQWSTCMKWEQVFVIVQSYKVEGAQTNTIMWQI